MGLSLDGPEAASLGDVKTGTQHPTNPHEVTLTRTAGTVEARSKGRMGEAMIDDHPVYTDS